MGQQYRQGDVFIETIDEVPSDVVLVEGPVVLAYGEVTGHSHQVKTKSAKLFERAGERFLVLNKKAVVEHQEHGPITLPAGTYRVTIQREYHPLEIKSVVD
ncbi:MAG: hypothetical protein KGL39_00635 [Patescibacteria group bacterium]|nr:hypothetical protein [Patescibacteria group bacterium]